MTPVPCESHNHHSIRWTASLPLPGPSLRDYEADLRVGCGRRPERVRRLRASAVGHSPQITMAEIPGVVVLRGRCPPARSTSPAGGSGVASEQRNAVLRGVDLAVRHCPFQASPCASWPFAPTIGVEATRHRFRGQCLSIRWPRPRPSGDTPDSRHTHRRGPPFPRPSRRP